MPRSEHIIPNRADITDDTPLRLRDAVAIAYPMGGVTVASLRREAQKGRLVIERMAGKDFVTLASIDRMRELCILPIPQSAAPAPRAGSSETAPGCTPQDALREKLRRRMQPLPPSSEKRTKGKAS